MTTDNLINFIGDKLAENNEIKVTLAKNENKYDALLQEINDIRKSTENSAPLSTQSSSIDTSSTSNVTERLFKLEEQVKISTLELKVMRSKIEENSNMLHEC